MLTHCILNVLYAGEDQPTLRDLYIHVSQEAANKWKDIGVLLIDPAILKVIEKDHPQDVTTCCKCMLEKWLDTQPDASWNQLLNALRSSCVQLNTLAHQIEQMLRKKCKTDFVEIDVIVLYVLDFLSLKLSIPQAITTSVSVTSNTQPSHSCNYCATWTSLLLNKLQN